MIVVIVIALVSLFLVHPTNVSMGLLSSLLYVSYCYMYVLITFDLLNTMIICLSVRDQCVHQDHYDLLLS